MKERPILFSAPMVRAILNGSKTQTRRVVKPQPVLTAGSGFAWKGFLHGRGGGHAETVRNFAGNCCPYGQPGDRLWVRETFALEHCVEHDQPPPHNDGRPIKRDVSGDGPLWLQPHYRATDTAPDLCCEREQCAQCRDGDMGPHWKPSIHMPRWASRLTLEISGARVERLWDITPAQAIAEGIEGTRPSNLCEMAWRDYAMAKYDPFEWFGRPVDSFHSLWVSINGTASWDVNPWVWVVEFKRVEVDRG